MVIFARLKTEAYVPITISGSSIMNKYAVFLHCENFDLTHNGVKDLYGLFITIWVESENEGEAGEKAIDFLKSELVFAEAFSSGSSTHPSIVVAVVHEMPFLIESKHTPYDFFLMSEE